MIDWIVVEVFVRYAIKRSLAISWRARVWWKLVKQNVLSTSNKTPFATLSPHYGHCDVITNKRLRPEFGDVDQLRSDFQIDWRTQTYCNAFEFIWFWNGHFFGHSYNSFQMLLRLLCRLANFRNAVIVVYIVMWFAPPSIFYGWQPQYFHSKSERKKTRKYT